MINILHREIFYLWYYFFVQFNQIFKFWALGIVIGSCVSVFLKNKLNNLMVGLSEKKMGILGIVPAAVLGVVSPICMYGTVPIIASLSKKGMREDWIAAFMMSSILLNPQLLFYSFALGTQMVIMRLVVSILGGCIMGILVHIYYKRTKFYQFNDFELPKNKDEDPNVIIRLLKNIWRNVKITLPYFLLGIMLTALYQRYVPEHWVMNLFGSNRGLGALMAAALGVPLYTCGGGSIPIIAAWMDSGMSNGSAIAFMVAGPATKITNLGAVKIILGIKNFIFYIVFSILFAICSGILIDIVF